MNFFFGGGKIFPNLLQKALWDSKLLPSREDSKWLARAYHFACQIFAPEVERQSRCPDNPFSLFETWFHNQQKTIKNRQWRENDPKTAHLVALSFLFFERVWGATAYYVWVV